MVRETLSFIADHYLTASRESFKGHALAEYLRHEAAEAIRSELSVSSLLVRGSAGQSRWADVPWIAVLDPVVTTSAVRGYYIVYLFAADMGHVYLCLGQATTIIRDEFGQDTHEELRRRAGRICDRIPEHSKRFSQQAVELKGLSRRAIDYEKAPAFSVRYDSAALPPEQDLVADLVEIVRLYLMLTARGGIDAIEVEPTADGDDGQTTLVERRRYRLHRKIDRNPRAGRLAKRIHGYQCQACGFDFEAVYGELGANYIEAHHLTPLADLPEDKPVPQDPEKDFAVLCANCHRMVHKSKIVIAVEEIRGLPGVGQIRTFNNRRPKDSK